MGRQAQEHVEKEADTAKKRVAALSGDALSVFDLQDRVRHSDVMRDTGYGALDLWKEHEGLAEPASHDPHHELIGDDLDPEHLPESEIKHSRSESGHPAVPFLRDRVDDV